MITDPTLGWSAHKLQGPRVTLCRPGLHQGLPTPRPVWAALGLGTGPVQQPVPRPVREELS